MKKHTSSQTKAKKGLKARAVATAVARKVADSVKKSIQERSGKVATKAAIVSSKLVSNMANGFARSRIIQQVPQKLKNAQVSTKTKVEAKQAAAEKPKKKLSARALGLTASHMRELESRLLSLQQELKDQLEGKAGIFNTSTQSESVIKGDDAEVAEKQRVSNAALQEIDFLKTRLGLVGRALAKMEAGVYGICEESEEPIGYERLSVVPWARFAVSVQEMHERKMRDYKVNRLRAEG